MDQFANQFPVLPITQPVAIILNLCKNTFNQPSFNIFLNPGLQLCESTEPKRGVVWIFFFDQHCSFQVVKDILDTLHLKADVEPKEAESFKEAHVVRD